MLLAPRYQGVDLPLYSPDTPVICTPQESDFVGLDSPTFLRAIWVDTPPWFRNISRVLEKTDNELALIAQGCGTLVVNHTWGLLPTSELDYDSPPKRFLPTDKQAKRLRLPLQHIVVAEVELLYDLMPIQPYSEAYTTIQAYTDRYKAGKSLSARLRDMYIDQFKTGIAASDMGESPKREAWLLDLDVKWW